MVVISGLAVTATVIVWRAAAGTGGAAYCRYCCTR